MTGIDYSAVLGDLAVKRDAIDSIIAGFQQLLGTAAGTPTAPVALPRAAKAPKPPTPPRVESKPPKKVVSLVAPKGKRRQLTPDDLEEMQALYEDGKPIGAIQKALGFDGPALIYYHAKAKGCSRGLAAGQRKCHGCGTATKFDPCHICSKPAKKSA